MVVITKIEDLPEKVRTALTECDYDTFEAYQDPNPGFWAWAFRFRWNNMPDYLEESLLTEDGWEGVEFNSWPPTANMEL